MTSLDDSFYNDVKTGKIEKCENCFYFIPMKILNIGNCIHTESDHFNHILNSNHFACTGFIKKEEIVL